MPVVQLMDTILHEVEEDCNNDSIDDGLKIDEIEASQSSYLSKIHGLQRGPDRLYKLQNESLYSFPRVYDPEGIEITTKWPHNSNGKSIPLISSLDKKIGMLMLFLRLVSLFHTLTIVLNTSYIFLYLNFSFYFNALQVLLSLE